MCCETILRYEKTFKRVNVVVVNLIYGEIQYVFKAVPNEIEARPNSNLNIKPVLGFKGSETRQSRISLCERNNRNW